ncbi:MAG TPA: flagellar hook-length control protein FliK, partial [Noviherbaspirillum sp.]|nr:flagellar hook-length control protein FliK [Noviherbaspirillum sp.]
MQTSPISNLSTVSNAPASAPDKQAGGFDKIFTREVASRKEAADASRGAERREAAPGREASAPSPNTPAAEAQPPAADTAAEETTGQPSADVLALVANMVQLAQGEGQATEEAAADAAEADAVLPGARRRGTPFAPQHGAIGSRANHGTQSRPEGSWAAQVERGTSVRVEAGRTDAATAAQPLSAATASAKPAVAGASDFGAILKDAAALQAPQQQQFELQPANARQAVEHLSPRVGSPGWDQALGQRIVWMVNGEQQSASLTLNPPELGPLKVVLQMTSNQASASFVAAQPEVRQALE